MDLKTLRERKGLTQQQLADCIGKDRTLITKIENDNSSPSVETAKAIAKVLGVNWTVFFEDEREDTSQITEQAATAEAQTGTDG